MNAFLVHGKSDSLDKSDYFLMFPVSSDVSLILFQISNTITDHYKLLQLGLKTKDLSIAIICNPEALEKYKPEDPESNIQRLIYMCSLFHNSLINIEFSIWVTNDSLYQPHEISNSVWYFNKEWIGDGNYILIKRPNTSVRHEHLFDNTIRGVDYKPVEEFANENNLDVISYDYDDEMEKIVDLMIHAKFVVSEFSGLSSLAIFIKCPLIIYTSQPFTMFLGGKERVISYGSSNLTLSPTTDAVSMGLLTQGPFEEGIYNGTPDTIGSVSKCLLRQTS